MQICQSYIGGKNRPHSQHWLAVCNKIKPAPIHLQVGDA